MDASFGDTNTALDTWAAQWQAEAMTSPCGSCTGRACTICSIRVGGSAKANGQPSGYAPKVLEYYNPDQSNAADTNGASSLLSLQASSDMTAGLLLNAGARQAASPSVQTMASAASTQNAIVLENMKQGTPESVWLIGQADSTIEGYAAQFTIDHGQRVDFKINTDATNYRIDIYRLGYYGGDGARLVDSFTKTLDSAQVQPVPLFDPTTKLVDAGNWSVSASWDIPSDATSGVYFAELTRLDTGGQNIIPFIVRDDEAPSDITFQTSDTTWQAYNWWGGYNLYGGVDDAGRIGRASAVSYNRPIITRDGGYSAGPQDFIFGEEYPAIRWLEENGYDVNYISGIDTARDGAQLLNSKVFLSVGHDEYWSADQRANVEAARDAGVNLAFLSGNEVYWETRWENSIDGTNTPYKTLVSYKETWSNADTDPGNTTGTWRDPEYGAGQPENALTGTIFTVDSYRLDTIKIPYDLSNFRFWANTAVADIQPGQEYSLTPNLLGYEWDSDLDNGSRPAGLIELSSTTVDVNTLLLDNGSTTGSGTASHSLTLYRAPSGALVFGAGTVYWTWGLDSHHDNEATPADPNVQQAMVNLFADMGIQPQTLMASLVIASQTTDNTPPVSTITSPTASDSFTATQPITITGTAVDSGGGSVAVVEVSTDGGASWHRADGYENWTYTWVPLAGGTYNIKSRAVDDSVNMETPGAGVNVTINAAATTTLFSPSDVPANPSETDDFVNLGVQFTSSQAGSIVGIRFYKGLGDGGTHVGSLWSSTGTLLASATFTEETDSGWQTVTFSNPVSISAGTSYVASYRSSGHYADTADYFDTAHTNGPLTAQAGNGLYAYGTDTAFPTVTSNYNYWVDVIYSPVVPVNVPPVGVNDSGFTAVLNTPITIPASLLLSNDTDPNGDVLSISGIGASSGGIATFDPVGNTITFTPSAGYTGAASFGYAISDGHGGTGSAQVSLTVVPPVTNASLFSSSDVPAVLSESDSSEINLGVQFVSSSNGVITGIKYYKSANDVGTHTGSLWTSTGTLLATATFTNESASGWQTVTFSSPVSISANTTYVASYHSNGNYADTSGYFGSEYINGVLTAPGGVNGVFTYGTENLFPTTSYGATNYWVDVIFSSTVGSTNHTPVANNDSGFTTAQNNTLSIAASALLANDTDSDGDALTITGAGLGVNGTAGYISNTNTVTFTPNAGYTGPASFQYAISDGHGGTATATVNLTVTASSNNPPVAVGDSGFTTSQNTALTIAASTLLANDTDADGDILTITGASGGVNGSASFNAQANTVTFTPTAGYTGPASFQYAIADGKGGTSTAIVNLNITAPPPGVSLFSSTDVPAVTSDSDGTAVNLGVKFVASGNGTITGIKYYKGAGDTGTHSGSLWSSSGTLLATATFTNETASGWQTVMFSSPVTITAGTTYVASYNSNGHYADTSGYFATSHVNGPLTAPGTDNGIYTYGAGTLFPTSSYGATNYWVDVLFSAASSGANQAPVAVNDSGFSAVQNTALSVSAASLLANDSDPDGDTLTVTGASGGVNGTAAYNAQTNTVTFTPTAGYVGAASFSYAISDGHGGTATATVDLTVTAAPNQPPVANDDNGLSTAQDTTLTIAAATLLGNDTDPNGDLLTVTGIVGGSSLNGTASFDAQTNTIAFIPTAGYTGPASFGYSVSDGHGGTATATVNLTVTGSASTVSLFSSSDTPAVLSDSDGSQVSLGTRFTSSVDGTITGIRYYKGAGDTGTHAGSLWSSTGTLLATGTFTNETSSGWQTLTFSSPVTITAGTTYVASYSSNGHYADTSDYFATSHTNGPLTAPASGNGIYTYGTGNLFPSSSYGATNYWADVLFSPASVGANQSPVAANDTGFSTTQDSILSISAATLLSNDSDPEGDPLTITGASGGVNGTAAYDAQTNTVTFTPTAGYTGSASFNYSIADGHGGTSTASVGLTVNPASSSTVSLFDASTTPSIVSAGDSNAVELGLKFQASSNGDITGIRFYKGPQNVGTHVADLWSADGTLLASATFTNETASGWQQVNFATPVTISAGTTYVASYHTPGNYSADPGLFATSLTNGPLTAPSSASIGGNGIYAYGSSSLFPTNTYNATSYGVDVLFRPQLAA